MRVRIHRGAHEIGGNCVEVEHKGARLVLDVGRPLSAERDDVVPLPDVQGLADGHADLLGVIITHAHQDHWGLVPDIARAVPLFMGGATERILAETAYWTTGLRVPVTGHLTHREPLQLGPFEVTPYLNDHSAFDAYSLLVEAGGRRLFYSGDIRGHGRKSAIFEELLRKPPNAVHVLLMEGTNIRGEAGPATAIATEADVERACTETFRGTPGIVLASFSSQNIDRLVTIYRATLQADRDLVLDLYTASVARVTQNPNIPRPGADWPRVHVYVPQWQRVRVKETGQFDRVAAMKSFRLYEEDLAAAPERFIVSFSMASAERFAAAGLLAGAHAVWSMWSGYLAEPRGQKMTEYLSAHHVPISLHHTSGHASVADLQRLVRSLNPERVVPIHSFGGHRFSSLFDRVEVQPDGAWWDV